MLLRTYEAVGNMAEGTSPAIKRSRVVEAETNSAAGKKNGKVAFVTGITGQVRRDMRGGRGGEKQSQQ